MPRVLPFVRHAAARRTPRLDATRQQVITLVNDIQILALACPLLLSVVAKVVRRLARDARVQAQQRS